jgi:hypothetical protein
MLKTVNFAKLMKLWLDLTKERKLPYQWADATFLLVITETSNQQKAEKLADIALQLSKEVAIVEGEL